MHEEMSIRNVVRKGRTVLSTVERKKNKEQIPPYHSATKNISLKNEIEHEIECPRCHDIMILQSEFDRFCYLCEVCRFTLSLMN